MPDSILVVYGIVEESSSSLGKVVVHRALLEVPSGLQSMVELGRY